MVRAADELLDATAIEDSGQPGAGLTLVLFAGELAAALQADEFRPELPAGLVEACEQTVTEATLVAAGCVAGLVPAVQALAGLIDLVGQRPTAFSRQPTGGPRR